MQQRLNIITLGVKNVEKSTQFYETKFGWSKSDDSNENITFFSLNGILLALYKSIELAEDATVDPVGDGFKAVTLAYNTKAETEVDLIFTDLENKGVKIIKNPEKVAWGGYSGYVSDIDDHLWEIAYNPFFNFED